VDFYLFRDPPYKSTCAIKIVHVVVKFSAGSYADDLSSYAETEGKRVVLAYVSMFDQWLRYQFTDSKSAFKEHYAYYALTTFRGNVQSFMRHVEECRLYILQGIIITF